MICTVLADGLTVEILGLTSTDFLLIFKLSGISNPSYQRQWPIQIVSYTRTGEIIEASGLTNFIYRSMPGQMFTTVTNVPGGSDVVAEYTDISVSFTVTNAMDQNGYFEL